MATVLHHRPRLLRAGTAIAVALWLLVGAGTTPGRATLLDAILAEVDGTTVSASDVALARALSLLGFQPTPAPIQAADVQRLVDAWLVDHEAARLGMEGTVEEVEAAWRAAGTRVGGPGGLTAWLQTAGIEPAWARELVQRDLRWRRFIHLRFEAFAFVAETDVLQALGPGPHAPDARERTRQALRREATDRELSRWLADARTRIRVHVLLPGPVPNPFPMPPASGQPAPSAGSD